MEITVTLPDELATRLQPVRNQLPQILEMGIREWEAHQSAGFAGLVDVMKTLTTVPAPHEVLALRPSPVLQDRINELLEKSQRSSLSLDEQMEWDQYEYVEHLVRLANAALKLQNA